MADKKFELQVFCTEHNLIRSTYFSDTYRATFELDGITKSWDITHISLPFREEKEKLLQARFGIPSSELFEFYKRFAKCVQNSMGIVKYINDIPLEEQTQNENGTAKRDPAVAVKRSAALYKYKRIIRKADKHGSDVYLVTEPLEPFVGSEFCNGYAISLSNLLSFAARATQIINGFAYYGFHIGAFDLDTIFFQTIDGKRFFTFGSFLYAGFDQDRVPETWKAPAWPDVKDLPTLPASADQTVKEGGAPSLVRDMHSLVALLWTILSGKHYRDAPDYEEAPRYAPAELLEVLIQGRDSEDPDTLRIMSKRFHALMRSIRRQELPDTIIHMEAAPDYLAEYTPELDEPDGQSAQGDANQDTAVSESAEESDSSNDAEPEEATTQPDTPDAEANGPEEPQQEIQAPDKQKEQPSAPDETIAEIVAEVVAVTVPTALAAKAVSEQLSSGGAPTEEPSAAESAKADETLSEKTPQDGPPELPQEPESPQPGTDTAEPENGLTDAPRGEETASEADGRETPEELKSKYGEAAASLPDKAAAVPETPAPEEPEGPQETAKSVTDEAPPVAPPENADTGEVPDEQPTAEPEHAPAPAPSPPQQDIPMEENPPQENETGDSSKAAEAPPTVTHAASGQTPYFPGPIFIPVPNYGQPGGQQGFMAVYPPQVMPGQQSEPVSQPAAAPSPSPQSQTPQQPAAVEQPAPVPKVETPAQATGPTPVSAPMQKPAQKVIRRTVTTYRKPKKQSKIGTFFLTLLLVAILAFLGACAAQYMGLDVPYDIPFIDELRGVSDFTVTPDTVTIHVGEEAILTSSEGCTLSSSDHNVAVVSDTGHVRGIGPGTCTITARASSSSATVRIIVTVLEGPA